MTCASITRTFYKGIKYENVYSRPYGLIYSFPTCGQTADRFRALGLIELEQKTIIKQQFTRLLYECVCWVSFNGSSFRISGNDSLKSKYFKTIFEQNISSQTTRKILFSYFYFVCVRLKLRFLFCILDQKSFQNDCFNVLKRNFF